MLPSQPHTSRLVVSEMKLYAKTLSLLAGLTTITVVASNLTFLATGRDLLVAGLQREAVALATAEAARLDASTYSALLRQPDHADSLGRVISAELAALQARLGRRGVENVYTLMLRQGRLLVAGDPSGAARPLTTTDTVNVDLKRRLLQSGQAGGTRRPYADAWGTWISGYAPLLDQGRPVALLGIDLPLGAFPVMTGLIERNVGISLLLGLALALLAGAVLAGRLTRPALRLTAALEQVRGGNLEIQLPVDSRDEFGRMSTAFNSMTRDLREQERIRSLFSRSVSPEIAEALISGRVRTEGELREASVLFADIRGFTALSETLAARDVVTLLRRYYDCLVPAVTGQGGVVDKFVGDEIFALFGAPLALDDDALSAVMAALDMRHRLEELNLELESAGRRPLAIGIGINTGAVVAGNFGSSERMNYTVVGQTVNLGARLVDAAAPGQILISEATWLRLQGRVQAQALPPLQVKGATYPLRVFSVTGLESPAAPGGGET